MESILEQKSWPESLTLKKLDINYLKKITKNFSKDQILGSGGYGIVYKGEHDNGEVVAVKKLIISTERIDDQQFMNEVQHVMDICHPNIVRLDGYCYHTESELFFQNGRLIVVHDVHRLLCFEYVHNGSLKKYLKDESSGLDWHARYKIIDGICAGLYCLHERREGAPILHLDLNPSNILLDKNMTPKIADFGLSRLFAEGKTHICTTNLAGTCGYMAPECITSSTISKESDIFSLGVIILEIVSGQKKYPEGTSNEEFIEVYEKWRTRLEKTSKKTSVEQECRQVDQCILIGRKCMAQDRKSRPNIRKIVKILGTITCSLREDGIYTSPVSSSSVAEAKLGIGIDLGMTNSCVGIWRNGRVKIVANNQGNRTTPSCVAFTDSERLTGEEAKNQIRKNTSNTVFDVKRLIGRGFSDASVQSDAKHWPFELIAGLDDKPLIRVSYLRSEKEFSPEEISAMVLIKMKETAEAYLGPGTTIKNAVVTVPAYFNNSQRKATKDAASIAGLNAMRIINEPTAAAMAYSLDRNWRDDQESTVLVYDLGGRTLDVSLVLDRKGVLQMKATAGDTHLGGEDFTNNMVYHFVNEFKKKNHKDISGDKRAVWRLRKSCEEAKRRLSSQHDTIVDIDFLFEGIDFYSKLSRDQFEQLNKELFLRCTGPIAKCLEDAKMDKTEVDDVVLLGGSTHMPRVRQLVQDFFNGKEPCRSANTNADEAVAYGATMLAGILMRDKKPDIYMHLVDVALTPLSLGVSTKGGLMRVVIPRNTKIPTTMEQTFTTTEDNQSSIVFAVYEGERAMTEDNSLVGKFMVSGIKLAPRQVSAIKVRFHIDQDGTLYVSAHDQESGQESKIVIKTDEGRLGTDEIQRMVNEAQMYKAVDEEHKKTVHARNDFEDMLYKMCSNMKNLNNSAGRLLLHQEATRGHEKETIKKLQNSIRKLQETADGTTKWLDENKELTISQITEKKMEIEGEYNSMNSLIESGPP